MNKLIKLGIILVIFCLIISAEVIILNNDLKKQQEIWNNHIRNGDIYDYPTGRWLPGVHIINNTEVKK